METGDRPPSAGHYTHLNPVNPKSAACRKPPMPVRKFTAPEPSAFSVHTCRGQRSQGLDPEDTPT